MPELFNVQGFGPPRGFTLSSTCPWVDQRVSRLLPATRRPFKTRFPFGSAGVQLSLAAESNSQAHYAKGTPSPRRAPTACKHMVSGTFHSPYRGAFHRSLALLVHYRSSRSTQAWRVVPPCSDRVSRARTYSMPCRNKHHYRTITFCGQPFTDCS